MAWVIPQKSERDENGNLRKRYCAGYAIGKGANRQRRSVKNPDGSNVIFYNKRECLRVANAEERRVRGAAPTALNTEATTLYRVWWEKNYDGNRHPGSDGDEQEQRIMRVHILPRWGDVPLNEITEQDIRDWIKDTLTPKVSAAYAEKLYYAFKVWVKLAVDKGVLTRAPYTDKMGLPKILKKERPYFLDSDIAALREAGFRDDYMDIVEFCFEVGVRPSEATGLHSAMLRLDKGFMVTRDVLVPGKRVIRESPKNGEPRKVPLTDRAIELVKLHIDGRDMTAGCGLVHLVGENLREVECATEVVFRNRQGGTVTARAITTALRDFCKANGLEYKSAYATRRGWSTWTADGGLDSEFRRTTMGHADDAQTDGYRQVTPAMRVRLQEARDRVKASSHDQTVSEPVTEPVTLVPGKTVEDVGESGDRHAA
ncbi:tyrosine-type recombinase/integrase [Amycolatopsis sp. cmx-8-4]|uniref:tyrosine-type recombinase/integrase n=1 Tax=Amycolatopsis sp. cmx-8-4 TaxID=2790947 RepID=UPI0039788E74